ncbi:MAG: Photosystem I reaction center subunit IX [Nostocaceae cyanobacterium]|nr:Photosystem I reaction center subunit IX [Nostocaceae cyanobacterium]
MQKNHFLQYLSLAPVLLFFLVFFTSSLLIEFNRLFPDLLFHPLP